MLWLLAILGLGGAYYTLLAQIAVLRKREAALLDALLKKSGYGKISESPEPPVHKVEHAYNNYAQVADVELRNLLVEDEIAEEVELAMENRPFTSEIDEQAAIRKFTAEAAARYRAANQVNGS